MPFSSKLSPEQWAEGRRMRVDGAIYAEIAERLGVSVHAVGHHARREGWPSPARPRSRPARAGSASPATAGVRSRLAQRLYRVIEFRIKLMELRMIKQLQAHESDPDGAPPPPPTKDDRDGFAALIDSINQVTEMASAPAPAADGRRRTATAAGAVNTDLTTLSDEIEPGGLAAASEKDALRREIAERLAKIFPPS